MTYPRQVPCPCCRFPTLDDRGGYEICVICWWEDDGQDDRDADEVRGGPNRHYSLSHARKNVLNHGYMYDEEDGISVVNQPSAARRELIAYLQTISFNPGFADPVHLGELLSAEDRHIRSRRQ